MRSVRTVQESESGGRKERGFTLIELLAAITVFSLVIMMLYSGFRLGSRSWEATERAGEAVSEMRLASAFLRRQLGKAMPLVVVSGRMRKLWFVGQHDRMVFVTDMAPYLGQAGPYELSLEIERGDPGRLTLARRVLRGVDGADSSAGDVQPKSLVDELEKAEFAYYGVPTRGAERGWYAQWADAERLPTMVRIRMVSRVAGEWPELIVHLKVDGTRYWRQTAIAQRGPTAATVQLAQARATP